MNCKYHIGDIVIVKISEVKPYAAFLNLDDGTSGMIHISEISDNYIRDIEKYVSKGDEVKVKILAIDDKDNFVRASFKQVPKDEQYSTHINSRKALTTDESEFEALKSQIPNWIEDSLARHNK